MGNIKTPWEKFMGGVPMNLEYPQGTMYECVKEACNKFPNKVAIDFMHGSVTYKKMLKYIDNIALSLSAIGINENDRIVISMPNCPQAIYTLYAANKIGAIPNFVHPLSAPKEMEFYIKESNSKMVLTLDALYSKFKDAVESCNVETFLISSIKDAIKPILKPIYELTEGRKIKSIPKEANVLYWKDFIKNTKEFVQTNKSKNDGAIILYSGGTTGTSKGILLTNMNFNSLARQIIATNPMFKPGDRMLAALPLFHGFGLGVCVHSMLASGGRCVLVPKFTAKSYAKLIIKYRCNFIAGVPTLFEALTRIKKMIKADLSCLKGVYSGGDNLSVDLKYNFDQFLKERFCKIQIREGYGATECVAASCLTPFETFKPGSIGIPFPDTYFKIVENGTDNEVPFNTTGEICISGPTVMKEYINHEDETLNVLHKDEDGRVWLHTGDLGMMDKDGFIYFKGRIKRMIITSGYNVYPKRIENIIDSLEQVKMSCVVGVPDSYKMSKIKAFVVLNPGYTGDNELKILIKNYLRNNLAKYEMPYAIEFRDDLPKTKVGKIAYTELEAEELRKELMKRSPAN